MDQREIENEIIAKIGLTIAVGGLGLWMLSSGLTSMSKGDPFTGVLLIGGGLLGLRGVYEIWGSSQPW